MNWKLGLVSFLLLTVSAHARLGETEAELIKRLGSPTLMSKHVVLTQGQILPFGPTYYFRQDDWSISCDVVDGRCMKISYSKPGDWTPDQIQLVLNSNTQGAKWTETSKTSIAILQRTWKRSDGSKATWGKGSGMNLTWSAYDKAKKAFEERARVESAIKKPKI